MRIYIFKSETKPGLQAFAGDEIGSQLPEQHGPWTVTGVVGTSSALPHNISRATIEEALAGEGFQMWRIGKTAEASA